MQAFSLISSHCILGEGPVWHDNALWWVDIEGMALFRWRAGDGEPARYGMPQRIGFAVPASGDFWVLGLQDGLHRWHPGTQTLDLLQAPEADLPDNRFNDGKCDPSGRLWAGTMSTKGEPGKGSLYRFDASGCHTVLPRVTISNGLAWDADRGILYYIDTPTREVTAFDYDPATGQIANRRTAIRIPAETGAPDGMTIDSTGRLWVALWGGGGVLQIDPLAGMVMDKIGVAARNVTSCTFGGPDLGTLFITTARAGLKPEQLAALPLSGNVFSVQPGATGLPLTPFRYLP